MSSVHTISTLVLPLFSLLCNTPTRDQTTVFKYYTVDELQHMPCIYFHFYFLTGSHCVAQASFELSIQGRVILNSWQSPWFSFLSAGISCLCHYIRLLDFRIFYTFTIGVLVHQIYFQEFDCLEYKYKQNHLEFLFLVGRNQISFYIDLLINSQNMTLYVTLLNLVKFNNLHIFYPSCGLLSFLSPSYCPGHVAVLIEAVTVAGSVLLQIPGAS